jgi:histone-lysine N-methyltransferase SETD3
LEYRQGQLHVLEGTLASVSDYLQHTISFNAFCPHLKQLSQTNGNGNFLSLECAFGWLQRHYQREHTAVTELIAEDQEEPLPLNWAIIIEEWDNAYWIVWILLLWMLWNREGDDFEIQHVDLYGWLSTWCS